MPLCGTSKDENTVPLGQRGGLQGRFEREQTHPGAVRHPSDGGDFQRKGILSMTRQPSSWMKVSFRGLRDIVRRAGWAGRSRRRRARLRTGACRQCGDEPHLSVAGRKCW